MSAKKETASTIHAERAFASAKIEGMLNCNKVTMEQEQNGNNATISLKDEFLRQLLLGHF